MSQDERREWLRLAHDMAEVCRRLDRSTEILSSVADTLLYRGASMRQLNYELKSQGAAEVRREKRLAA